MDIERQAYDLINTIIKDADDRFNLKVYGRADFGDAVTLRFVCRVKGNWYSWDFTYSYEALTEAVVEGVLLHRPFEYNRQLAEIRSKRERPAPAPYPEE